MSDLLTTCYGDYISVERPETSIQSLNNSFEEERVPSPVQSVSSRVSCFSQRLFALDKKRNEEKIKSTTGRGPAIDTNSSQIDRRNDDDDDSSARNSNATSPIPSTMNSSEFYFDNKKK